MSHRVLNVGRRASKLVEAGLFCGLVMGASAQAATVTVPVDVKADLFNAAPGTVFDGLSPVAINVSGLASVTFDVSILGQISYDGGGHTNNADGIGSAQGIFSSGGNGISGITAPHAGFLAGVFLSASPAGTAPSALDFTASGTSFASLSPVLQQSFFIGDGKTGDQSGATQTFFVPTGATTLHLGFIDACGYSGGPGCYSSDNLGSLQVVTQITQAVPEPEQLAMLLAGLCVVGYSVKGRRKQK